MKTFLSLVTYAAGFVLVWNLMAFLMCMFTGGAFEFTVGGAMLAPLTLCLIIKAVELTTKKRNSARA